MHDESNLAENHQFVRGCGALVHETASGLKYLVVEQACTQDPSWPDIDPVVDIWRLLLGFIDRDAIRKAIARRDAVRSYTALARWGFRLSPSPRQGKRSELSQMASTIP